MARNFTGTSSMRLISTTTPMSSVAPFTMAAWYRPGLTQAGVIMSLIDTSVDADYFVLQHGITLTNRTGGQNRDGGGTIGPFETSTSLTVNTWGHGAVVVSSTSSRAVYLNAGGVTTQGGAVTLQAWDSITIGARSGSTYYTGQVAEAAIWNVALTVDELSILSDGYSPLFVRPDSLAFYAPLIGQDSPEIDLISGTVLTLTNAPTAFAHPRIIRPYRMLTTYDIPSVTAVTRANAYIIG